MLLKHFIRQQTGHQFQGFTLIEVLAAILMVSFFVTVTMQSLVIASVFKVRAKEYNAATIWIQQHLEDAKAQAFQLSFDPTKCKATSATAGFAQALNNALPALDSSNTSQTIAGKTYTISRISEIGGTTPVSGSCQSNACYEVLKLTYSVTSGSSSVAQMYTEVIPAASFECPQ